MSSPSQEQQTQGARGMWGSPAGPVAATPARNVVRRTWLLVVLAIAAGAITWFLVRDDPKTYERTLTFVILPSAKLDVGEIPDALRSLDQQNSQISGTIAAAVGSKQFLRTAARVALRRPLGPGYEIGAGVRPGSDALSVRLRGPDARVLASVASVLSVRAIRWVDANMRSYRLQRLDNAAPTGPVAPKTFQLVAVAAFLAAALAFGAAYLEGTARARRGRAGDSSVASAEVQAPSNVLRYDADPRFERRQDGDTRRQG